MNSDPLAAYNTRNTLAVILGGGRGTRLYPLTQERCKPAVPLGGRYRLIDIPVSNCINSGMRRIFVVTQFNSTSLHRHINETYKMDVFGGGYVEILAAQQTEVDMSWFEGTADAVRKCQRHLDLDDVDRILILSGDQLYRMDFRRLIRTHVDSGAEATVAALPVPANEVSRLGILQVDSTGRIVRFVEKPKDPDIQKSLVCPHDVFDRYNIKPSGRSHLASMGIYLFEKQTLFDLLGRKEMVDFGRQVFPQAISERRVSAHLFDGYWQDIGTIGSFFEANLALTDWMPPFNLYEPDGMVFTHPRFLPPAKINDAVIRQSIVAEGSIVDQARIERAIIGLRGVVRKGVEIRNSIFLGADYYDNSPRHSRDLPPGAPPLGIGEGTRIENAIVDKNARVGARCVITNAAKVREADGPNYCIRDGIIVIPRKAIVPAGTVI